MKEGRIGDGWLSIVRNLGYVMFVYARDGDGGFFISFISDESFSKNKSIRNVG